MVYVNIAKMYIVNCDFCISTNFLYKYSIMNLLPFNSFENQSEGIEQNWKNKNTIQDYSGDHFYFKINFLHLMIFFLVEEQFGRIEGIIVEKHVFSLG